MNLYDIIGLGHGRTFQFPYGGGCKNRLCIPQADGTAYCKGTDSVIWFFPRNRKRPWYTDCHCGRSAWHEDR